jgi:hypothetical protein
LQREDARNDRFSVSFEDGIIEDFGLSDSHDVCPVTGQ